MVSACMRRGEGFSVVALLEGREGRRGGAAVLDPGL